jgi:hypothetical protein
LINTVSNRVNQQRIANVLIICITLLVLSFIPFKIISLGFLSGDDALSSAAKVVSGKDWHDIIVLRDVFKLDNHPGWHAILTAVYRITGCSTHDLVLFSVISMFLLFTAIPLIYFKRPEAWILTLLFFQLTTGLTFRLLLGRPYIIFMASILMICALWPGFEGKRPYKSFILTALAIALSTWTHASWYLFLFPFIALLASRRWRASGLYIASMGCGVVTGALLTGHPYFFIKQNFEHLFIVFGNCAYSRMLVTELQPFSGDILFLMALALILLWHNARKNKMPKLMYNPVFLLGVICWPLGFIAGRTWSDIGLVAMVYFIYNEFDELLPSLFNTEWLKRVVLALVLLAVYYIAATSDVGSRWSGLRPFPYLAEDDPKLAGMMPEKGGIIYSDSMGVFFSTFYKNPNAPWKYILGFESAMMPPEDLSIYRNIQMTFGKAESYQPWVTKMKSEDRLITCGRDDKPPEIKGLKWESPGSGIWIGLKERK